MSKYQPGFIDSDPYPEFTLRLLSSATSSSDEWPLGEAKFVSVCDIDLKSSCLIVIFPFCTSFLARVFGKNHITLNIIKFNTLVLLATTAHVLAAQFTEENPVAPYFPLAPENSEKEIIHSNVVPAEVIVGFKDGITAREQESIIQMKMEVVLEIHHIS